MENDTSTDLKINISTQRGKMQGVVVENKRYKEGTVTVLVTRSFRHPKYHKIITTSKKYLCQYNQKDQEIEIGTKVTLCQISPQSKRKNTLIELNAGAQ